MAILKLESNLTEKEVKKFKIPNTLELSNFNGMQYAMCLGAVYKDNSRTYQYIPEFSMGYINTEITPMKLISFCELHKDLIIKDRTYMNGHFANIYYIKYVREEQPMLVNAFCNFNRNRIDVELTFNENGYYSVNDIHLELSPNTSIIRAIESLFSNENIEAIPFISTDNNNYYISYYDDYGKEKKYRYQSIMQIFDRIVNVRLIGCIEVGDFNEQRTDFKDYFWTC